LIEHAGFLLAAGGRAWHHAARGGDASPDELRAIEEQYAGMVDDVCDAMGADYDVWGLPDAELDALIGIIEAHRPGLPAGWLAAVRAAGVAAYGDEPGAGEGGAA
jgi:hypothetical protein